MEKLNTKLTFYWTVLQDREFKKLVFQTVLPGKPFDSIYDVQEWEEERTPEFFDGYNFEIVFDHVILQYSPTDDDVQDVHIIDEIPGTLTFRSKTKKVRKKKDDSNLKVTIKSLEKQIEEIRSCDVIKYDLIESEYLSLELEKLNLEIENLQLKQQIIDASKEEEVETKIPKLRQYQSIWMDRSGVVYNVGFACHEEFAQDILDKRDEKLDRSEHYYAYEVLQDEGWIRVLGWCDPPVFVLPDRITPSQKTALREYCQSQNVTFTAMPEILKG